MGNLRPVLLISLGLLGYMLWIEWQKDYHTPLTPAGTELVSTSPASAADQNDDLPAGAGQPAPADAPDVPQPLKPGQDARGNSLLQHWLTDPA